MKRVLITGASGMIGASLAELALSRGVEVVALVRPGRADSLARHPLLRVVECDLAALAGCDDLPQCDALFHLAWDKTVGEGRDDAQTQAKNVMYTLDAARLAAKIGCAVFVGAGSQAEYGCVSVPLNSQTPADPQSAYGVAKYAAGKLSALLCGRLGVRHCWARILSVYGDRDRVGSLVSMCADAFSRGRSPDLTLCEQTWDYLHCADAARALWAIAERGRDQAVYCVGSGDARPLRDYVLAIRDAANPNLPVRFGEKPYPPNQPMYLCADIAELTQDTGFVPQIKFEEGIREVVRYRASALTPDS